MQHRFWVGFWNATKSGLCMPSGKTPRCSQKPNWHQKKGLFIVGGLLPIQPTTAYWISVKSLHLRTAQQVNEMYWRLQHLFWSTEGPQVCTTPDSCHITNASKVEWIKLQSVPHLLYLYLTSHQPATSSSTLTTSPTSRMQKYFLRIHQIWSIAFCA